MRLISFFLLLLTCALCGPSAGYAQQFSENGWHLPPHGTIRVLVLYIEIDYDKHPEYDPHPAEGISHWKAGQLPNWHNKLFDAHPGGGTSGGMVTAFFHEASFGNYTVLGDHLNRVITVKESDIHYFNKSNVMKQVFVEANARDSLQTWHGLQPQDFDHLSISKPGLPKPQPSTDKHLRYDHIMFCFRNFHLENKNSGWANVSSLPPLYGHYSDTFSSFRVGGNPPFYISRHEFSHLLFGGNNFHVGGGQHSGGGGNHFIPTQGGWSCMGGASSSFQTCNAWDRDRMGWKPAEKQFTISALNAQGEEVRTDFQDVTSRAIDTVVVVRDFVLTGDAVRLKLPGIPADEYQQYIWIENHQGFERNGSRFDRFQYQANECVDRPTPGLYMYLQVDKDQKRGQHIYGGWGDYLRPISAEGFYDYQFEDSLMQNHCINMGRYPPFSKRRRWANPLTGSHDMEMPAIDLKNDGKIGRTDGVIPGIERVNGQLVYNYPQLGDARDAFTLRGNARMGVGTNPSTNSMLTLASLDRGYNIDKRLGWPVAPDNRTVFLSGLRIDIVKETDDGDIHIRIRNTDNEVSEDVRWCGDHIRFGNPLLNGQNLVITGNAQLRLDRGETPTRLDFPDTVNNKLLFTPPTWFQLDSATRVRVTDNATLDCRRHSALKMKKEAELVLEGTAACIFQDGAILDADSAAKLLVTGDARLVFKRGAVIAVPFESVWGRHPGNARELQQIVAIGGTVARKGGLKLVEENESWVEYEVQQTIEFGRKRGWVWRLFHR